MKKNLIAIILLILFIILGATNVFAEYRNNNPLLREILIDGERIEPEFDQFITDYVIAVQKEKINIEATADDPNAKVEIIGSTNLKVGNNDIEIKVTAEDGQTTQSYFLHITRGDAQQANANLKSLEVEGYTLNPSFNNRDIDYLIEYEGKIESLKIKASPESDKATVEILNNNNFNSIFHIVTIKVTAENGITSKEYKITAKQHREKEEEEEIENSQDHEEEKNENVQENVEVNEQKDSIDSENKIVEVDSKEYSSQGEHENKGFNFIFMVIGIIILVIIILAIIYKKMNKKNSGV